MMKLHIIVGLAGFALLQPAAASQRHTAIVTQGTVLSAPATDNQSRSPATTPTRGMSKSDVIDVYGQPGQRHAPVGDPPITRWDYPQFSVFFEYDLVLHSVIPGDPPALYHRKQLAAGD